GASRRVHVSQCRLGSFGIGRIDEHSNARGCGHQLTQELQPLCGQLVIEKIDTRQVTSWPGEAGDKAKPDRVFADAEDDGTRCGGRLGRQCYVAPSGRSDNGDLPPNQLGRQRRQPIVLALRPAVLDRHVLTLDEARFLQPIAECAQTVREGFRRYRVDKPDHRHRGLLRARRERPRNCCAAEQRDERAPLHSITSSARASSDGGMVRPSTFAVVWWMVSSNLVGCWTGISPGFAPRRILSTYSAARRNRSAMFGP